MSTETVLEKIKKLLRLGRSSNAHEAGLALQRAFELAQRHNIDLEGVDLDEETERIMHEYVHAGRRIDHLSKMALNVVVRFFNVNAVICRPRVCFIGKPTDIAIATYAHAFIVRSGRNCLRDFNAAERRARRKVGGAKSRQFVSGFIYGLSHTLNEAQEKAAMDDSKTAIVVAEGKARENYRDQLFGNTRALPIEQGPRNRTALMAGFHEGEKTRIHNPLGASPREVLALTE